MGGGSGLMYRLDKLTVTLEKNFLFFCIILLYQRTSAYFTQFWGLKFANQIPFRVKFMPNSMSAQGIPPWLLPTGENIYMNHKTGGQIY